MNSQYCIYYKLSDNNFRVLKSPKKISKSLEHIQSYYHQIKCIGTKCTFRNFQMILTKV